MWQIKGIKGALENHVLLIDRRDTKNDIVAILFLGLADDKCPTHPQTVTGSVLTLCLY